VRQEAWSLLSQLLEYRLADAHQHLENCDEKEFKFQQGRVFELRHMLELEGTAKAVLEKHRTPRGISEID